MTRSEGLIAALVGRILTSLLVGGGSQIVHTVVNKARAPLYPEVEL